MKKLITLFTILLSTAAFSQEITIEKNRFLAEGKQISAKEVKTLLEKNYSNHNLYKILKITLLA